MEELTLNVGFKIEGVDPSNNSMIVRPCSTNFKNSPESYPLYNISISNLDPNKNIPEQIIEMLSPTVKSIVASENEETVSSILEFAEANQNKVISVDKTFNKKTQPAPQPIVTDTIRPTANFEVLA